MFIFLFYILCLLILLSNDIELNPGPKQSDQLSILHVNVNSILVQPKLLELSALTNDYHYDVTALCETWLDDSIPYDRLLIPGYSEPLRKDRNRRGGGVLLYFSESLPVVHRSDLEINGLDVKLRNESILIAEFYRSPSQNSSEELTLFFEKFQSSLDLASSIPNSSIVILGDLNGPNLYCIVLYFTGTGTQIVQHAKTWQAHLFSSSAWRTISLNS